MNKKEYIKIVSKYGDCEPQNISMNNTYDINKKNTWPGANKTTQKTGAYKPKNWNP